MIVPTTNTQTPSYLNKLTLERKVADSRMSYFACEYKTDDLISKQMCTHLVTTNLNAYLKLT